MNNQTKNILLAAGSVIFTFLTVETFSFIIRNILEGDISLNITNPLPAHNHNPNVNTQIPLRSKDSKTNNLPRTHREFRLGRPLPYKNSAYFNWYINEEWTDQHPECKSIISHNGNGYELKQSDTPLCRGYTIKNGWRVTTDLPSRASKNIFIYGGSTVQNHEVPNEFTIASYLQRLLNNYGHDYQVNNRGFTTVVTNQQNDFLRKEAINSSDIVIFYDGGNNQWQSVANNSPRGTIIGSNRRLSILQKIKYFISSLQSYKLISSLSSVSNTENSCYSLSNEELENRAHKGFDVYKEDLMHSKKLVASSGAHFVHFMQPHLFSAKKIQRSEYERNLARNYNGSHMVPLCAENYLSVGSRIFTQRHSELLNSGIDSVDLGMIFALDNPRRPIGEHFLDWIHITENGNQAIARQMYSKLLELNLLVPGL